MTSDCVECGSTENVVDHHVQYEPEETIPVCRVCHGVIHCDEEHELHPVDDIPEGFEREYGGMTTLTINEDIRDELRSEKIGGETYEDVLWRLLENDDE